MHSELSVNATLLDLPVAGAAVSFGVQAKAAKKQEQESDAEAEEEAQEEDEEAAEHAETTTEQPKINNKPVVSPLTVFSCCTSPEYCQDT